MKTLELIGQTDLKLHIATTRGQISFSFDSEHHPQDICISYFLTEVRRVKQKVDSVSWGQGL